MTRPFLNLLLSAVLTTGATSSALAAGLKVAVDGVRNDQGNLWIMLYQGEASGMPSEGYGFTRYAGRDAMPTFEQASIRLPEDRGTRIALAYLQP